MFQCDSRLPPSPTVPFACELRFFLFNLQSTGSDHVGNSRSGRGLQPLHFPSEHPIILTSYSLSRSTATLMDFPASVANKRLTARLNSLDATLHLQETRGEVVPDSGAHHSLLNSNPFLSHSYALFCAAKKSTHLFSSDSALSTAKHRDGGYPYPWGLCLSNGGVYELEDPGPAGTGWVSLPTHSLSTVGCQPIRGEEGAPC